MTTDDQVSSILHRASRLDQQCGRAVLAAADAWAKARMSGYYNLHPGILEEAERRLDAAVNAWRETVARRDERATVRAAVVQAVANQTYVDSRRKSMSEGEARRLAELFVTALSEERYDKLAGSDAVQRILHPSPGIRDLLAGIVEAEQRFAAAVNAWRDRGAS